MKFVAMMFDSHGSGTVDVLGRRARALTCAEILALSGGGFRGLYTAKVIADVEREINAPFASRFDLITGTSIGGIVALALALEIPAQDIVDLFVDHGEEIFNKRWSLFGFVRAPYSPAPLMGLLSRSKLFGDLNFGRVQAPSDHPEPELLDWRTGDLQDAAPRRLQARP